MRIPTIPVVWGCLAYSGGDLKLDLMKAIRIEAPRLPWQISDLPVPSPRAGEVVVRVRASGICGADLEISRGEYLLARLPLTPGHEVAGVVDRVGPGADGFRPGDRVGAGWLQGTCGKCESCLAGKETLCVDQIATGVNMDGGHAEFVLVNANYLHHLPSGMPFEHAAALMCPGMTAYSALKLSNPRPGARVAILGLGGVGHLAVQFAKAMGAEVAVVTRGGEEKLALARELGADHTLDSRQSGAGRALQSIGGVEVILACSISARETSDALSGLKPDGSVVLIGVPPEPIPVHADHLCVGRHRLIGLPSGGRTEIREALALATRKGVRPIVETYPLSEYSRGLDRMEKGLVRFRAVLVP